MMWYCTQKRNKVLYKAPQCKEAESNNLARRCSNLWKTVQEMGTGN